MGEEWERVNVRGTNSNTKIRKERVNTFKNLWPVGHKAPKLLNSGKKQREGWK